MSLATERSLDEQPEERTGNPAAGLPILRNTILLSASTATVNGMAQLTVAVSTLTLALVTGHKSLAGVGPFIFLLMSALAALPAGRLMDGIGRIPVLAGGYVIGLAGALVTAVGTHVGSTTLAVLGFAMIGVALGTTKLSRTAAADMYPPEKRARGISFVLFGAVFGAILGPAVFTPLFKGHNHGSSALVEGWIAAAAFMAVGLLLVLFVRPD